MADTRINALSTATVSETTDYLPIDGDTGTRKLSAYSPSFGGNATVGGTLTVSGATINTTGTNAAVKSTDGAVITKVQSVVSTPIGIVGTESNHDLGVYTNNTNRLNVSAAGVVSISGTTASTSTSTGALTVGNGVSGGLGVGGAINAGGDIITTKSNGVIKASGSSANAEVAAERLTLTPSSVSMVAAVSQPQLAFTSDTAGSYTWGRILANSSEIVRVHSANLTAIANVAGAGIAVAGGIINTGSLTTGAPSGGTSAAWKLGTVASVSPTSPNRTIEVDIGGTIYYIHAKTTNN